MKTIQKFLNQNSHLPLPYFPVHYTRSHFSYSIFMRLMLLNFLPIQAQCSVNAHVSSPPTRITSKKSSPRSSCALSKRNENVNRSKSTSMSWRIYGVAIRTMRTTSNVNCSLTSSMTTIQCPSRRWSESVRWGGEEIYEHSISSPQKNFSSIHQPQEL